MSLQEILLENSIKGITALYGVTLEMERFSRPARNLKGTTPLSSFRY